MTHFNIKSNIINACSKPIKFQCKNTSFRCVCNMQQTPNKIPNIVDAFSKHTKFQRKNTHFRCSAIQHKVTNIIDAFSRHTKFQRQNALHFNIKSQTLSMHVQSTSNSNAKTHPFGVFATSSKIKMAIWGRDHSSPPWRGDFSLRITSKIGEK